MQGGATSELPLAMRKVHRRLERWRSKRTGRARIPEALWAAAGELAREHGVNAVPYRGPFTVTDRDFRPRSGRKSRSVTEDLGESCQDGVVLPVSVGLFQGLDLVQVSVDQLPD